MICSFLKRKIRLLNRSAGKPYLRLEQLIGYKPRNLKLYTTAFTHRSASRGKRRESNERLEFLGDSVISLVVGHALFDLYPEESEGQLTSLRSILVNRNNLNHVAQKLGLEHYLHSSKGLDKQGSAALGNCLEALVGAIYLDKGYDAARKFVLKHVVIDVKNIEKTSVKEENFKTEFIIFMQRNKIDYEYRDLDSFVDPNLGLMHRCAIFTDGRQKPLAIGVGHNKKIAHQNASKDAMKLIKKYQEDLSLLQDHQPQASIH